MCMCACVCVCVCVCPGGGGGWLRHLLTSASCVIPSIFHAGRVCQLLELSSKYMLPWLVRKTETESFLVVDP